MLRRLSVLLLILSLWTADAHADNPTAQARPAQADAWLLVGVQPKNARIGIVPITVKDGVVKRVGVQLMLYKPVDRFVLIKVHPGELYGIDQSALTAGPFQLLYEAGCGVPTFSASAGKVEYITTVYYRSAGASSNGVSMTFEENARYYKDEDGAKAFLSSHYPDLVGNLEQGGYQMTPFAHACPTP